MKDFEEKGACQRSSKSRQKQGIDLRPLQIFKTMCVERVLFQAGNRQLSQKFPEKGYSPQVPKNWEETFPVNSLNFKGTQLSMQFKNSIQKSRSIPVL